MDKVTKVDYVNILQEKERLDRKYTYRVTCKTKDFRKGGAGSSHSEFFVDVPSIPNMEIKDCVVRVRSLILPKDSVINLCECLIETDFLKAGKNYNQTFPNDMTSSTLAYVILNQQTFNFTSTTAIATNDGYRKFLNTGEVINGGNAVPGGGAINTCVGGEILPILAGWVGKPITEDWIECNNPFGRRINFTIRTQTGGALLNTSLSNATNVILELEIKMLPNPIKAIMNT